MNQLLQSSKSNYSLSFIPWQISTLVSLLLLAIFTPDAFALPTAVPKISFVTPSGAGAKTGLSWADASSNLQNMINASGSGDQVWVAGGTYTAELDEVYYRTFKMKEGVKIYGGFAGTELTLAARDLSIIANTSTLSGRDATGSVVRNVNNGLTSAAMLNGFTVSGGSIVIRNTNSSPMFINVTVIGCLMNDNASPLLVNCTIFNNAGSGMYNTTSSPILINCTIGTAGRFGLKRVGISNLTNSAPQIHNSIILGDDNGIVNEAGSVTVIRYSLVKGENDPDPAHYNLPGDITPLFVDVNQGNFRLQACSPGINRGSSSYYASGQTPDISGISTDMDGNSRAYDGSIDMGAYEFQSETNVGVPGVWYVKPGGTGSGVSWDCASGSLQIAINSAAIGDQVWVAGGTYTAEQDEVYNRSFKMKEGVKIYGGFAGTESTLAARDLSIIANTSTLSGRDATGSVVRNVNNGLTSAAILNGFTVTGGSIVIRNTNSSPTIVNVTIIGCLMNDNASPLLVNCTIFNNAGSGMYNTTSSPILINCTIGTAGRFGLKRVGISNLTNSAPQIHNSIILGDDKGIVNESGSVTVIRYSLVKGENDPNPANHNLPGNIDPIFADAEAGDFRLCSCSPAIDKGSNHYYSSGQNPDLSTVTRDLKGNNRFYNNGVVDIGAFETQGNATVSDAGITYVKAEGAFSGVSWDCAIGDLKLAINNAASGEQVWVARGTFQPADQGNFAMKEGVKIYGGFAGTETSLADRDLSIVANKSILQAYGHTVIYNYGVTLTTAAVLDGFTIRGSSNGPGIQHYDGSPMLSNLIITEHTAHGGMTIWGASPVLTNCSFIGNYSYVGGGLLISGGSPKLINCSFTGNNGVDGAGIFIDKASPILVNCLIKGNTATGGGGGMWVSTSTTSVTNCTIVGNTASGQGGGILNHGTSPLILRNSIVYGNNTGIVNLDPPAITVQYSLVQNDPIPGRPLPTNIDPLFVNAAGGDYRLQPCSPLVNAGFNYFNSGLTPDLSGITTDLDNKARLREHIVDMGAYEFSGASRALATDMDEASANITRDYVLTSFNSDCRLVAYINPTGTSPVSGYISAKVWIASAQPTNFVKRHYQISPGNNAASATAKLTLFFTQQEFDDFNAVSSTKLPINAADAANYRANLLIEKRPGYSMDGTGLPNSYIGTVATFKPSDANGKVEWNEDQQYWEVTFDVTGFSGFFVKTTDSALPLNLISFTATRENGSNLLQWSTTSEVNTDNFEIQRSGDAKNFIKIASVNAAGSGDFQYRYNDRTDYGGTVYYRLKMSDRDKTFTYSKIISIAGYENFAGIYPNPAGAMVTFQVNDVLLKTTANLHDMSGRRIQSIIITTNKQQINVKALTSGMYILKFADGTVERFVKE